MRRIAARNWGVGLEILTHIYSMTFAPIVYYGANCCGDACSKKYIKRLVNAKQIDILVRCIRAYRTTTLSITLAISGFPPLHQVILSTFQTYQELRRNKQLIGETQLRNCFHLVPFHIPVAGVQFQMT